MMLKMAMAVITSMREKALVVTGIGLCFIITGIANILKRVNPGYKRIKYGIKLSIMVRLFFEYGRNRPTINALPITRLPVAIR